MREKGIDISGQLSKAFDWDLATRLTSITQGMEVAALDWDGFGSLTGLTAGGVTRTYVWCYALAFPQMAVEREKGVDRRYFVHDPAGRLLYAVEAATSERRFFHYDERSNTAFVTDDAGTVVASFAYSPYGDVAASGPEAADQPFTFAGEWGGFSLGSLGSIGEGLFVMHRRVYDARTAAFLSRDASFPHLHPLTIDPYQYAARDPLRFFDPAGNEPQSPDAASQNASTGSGLATAAQVVNDVTTTAAVVGSELGDHAEEVAKAANRALGASDTLAGAAGELIEAQRGGSEATAKVLKTAEGYRETFDALDARATKLAGAADTLKTVGKVGNVLGAVDIGSTLWTLFDKNRQANAFRTDMEEQLYRAYVERCVTAVEIYLRAKRSETWLISQLNLSRYALERELLWSNYLGGIDSQIDFWTAVGDIYGSFVPGFGLVGTEAIAESAHRNVWSKVYGN